MTAKIETYINGKKDTTFIIGAVDLTAIIKEVKSIYHNVEHFQYKIIDFWFTGESIDHKILV